MKKIVKLLVLSCITVGMTVGCDSNSSSSQEIISSSSSSSAESSTSSSSISYTSSIITPVAVGISLNADNVKKEYNQGEALDLTGLVVNEVFDNNTSELVSGFTTNPANDSTLNECGEITITVSYSTFTASFKINVNPLLTGITLDTTNVKKTYEQGESLDLTGLVVNGQYSNNSTKAISGYTTSPENNTVLNEIGNFDVTVSYETFSKSFSITVTKATKKNWTESESLIMSSHLNGVVLPYTGSEDAVVSYSEEYDTVYIRGGSAASTDLANYASAMATAGFERISTTSYLYQKVVNNGEGDRYAKVMFYPDEDNEFYLEAYDPYLYSFPTAFATKVAREQLYSNCVMPEFSADRYEIDENNVAIYCYTNNAEAANNYTTILSNAGWDLTGGMDQGFNTAISPDRAYILYYKYNTELKSLDIYFAPPKWWNTGIVEAFYQKYSTYVPSIPSLDVEGASYTFWEHPSNDAWYAQGSIELIHAEMFIHGATTNNLAPYAQTLRTAGWNVEASASGGYEAKLTIPDLGVERIDFYYSTSDKCVIVTFYVKIEPLPGAWPAAEIAAALGSRVTEVLPPYEGATTGCAFYSDSWGTFVLVEVETGTEDDAVACYEQTLVDNGYTKSDYYYYSPKKQIKVYPTWVEYGSITINFYKNTK